MFSSTLPSPALSLVVVYLLWTGPEAAAFDPATICTLIANGTKIKDPRACDTWIECIDGEPVTGSCDAGFFYDRSTFECLPSDEITCLTTSPCSAYINPGGIFVADPYSCTSYYYCNGSTVGRGECSDNRVFNPESQLCSATYVCVLPMDPNSYCNIVPDGVFIGMRDNCEAYQMCWNGNVVNHTCPQGFYFDPLRGVCDYSSYVRCDGSTQPDEDLSAGCPEAGVFIGDGRTCNGYYYCVASESSETGYTLLGGSCPSGWFFDAANGGVCVPRTRIECAYDRCAGMGLDRIELANQSDDECRGFSICQNGVSIGAGSCPDGRYFDEEEQWCTDRVVQYVACAGAEGAATTEGGEASSEATTAATTEEGDGGEHTPPTDAATASTVPDDGAGDEMPTEATGEAVGEATDGVQAASGSTQNDVRNTTTTTEATTTAQTTTKTTTTTTPETRTPETTTTPETPTPEATPTTFSYVEPATTIAPPTVVPHSN